MAEALGGKGEVGIVFLDANFWVTNQRAEGFKYRIKTKYPDIKIVAERRRRADIRDQPGSCEKDCTGAGRPQKKRPDHRP
jgi:hypothetical protein